MAKPKITITVQDRETGERREVEVTLGMGATYYVGSDRYPFTVIEVVSPTRLKVQADEFRRTDHEGPFTENQHYEFSPNPDGRIVLISRRKHGWSAVGEKRVRGIGFAVGHRDAYQDPCF